MRGADRLIQALEREGVDTVFGSRAVLRCPSTTRSHDSPIRHVLVRHEAAAGPRGRGLREGDAAASASRS